MGETDQMLERMITNLKSEMINRFDRLDDKMEKYASKESVRYLSWGLFALFLLVLSLHGFKDVFNVVVDLFSSNGA